MNGLEMLDIILVIDMSSSIGILSQNYVMCLNNIIETQKRFSPNARLSLITFSHVSTVHFCHLPIVSLAPFPLTFLQPNGGTALYDTIMTVCNLQKNNQNPIICVIMTDGEDNCSRIEPLVVSSYVKHIQQQNWRFLFLGPENYNKQKGAGEKMGINC